MHPLQAEMNQRATRPRRQAAEVLFFPLAALYGALAMPLFLYTWMSGRVLVPGLATPAGHAHELLFGYALAVVAGYLVSRATCRHILTLLVLWLLARITWLGFPWSVTAALANTAFAVTLALTVAPKFMKGAKKWRNKLTGPLLIAISLAPVGFHLAGLVGAPGVQYPLLHVAVLLLALLMLFMGGRIIAPAVAGHIEKNGGELHARVQPRIEGALIVVMIVAVTTALVPAGALLTGGALVVAGALAAIRLGRWRLWYCWPRMDLLCLGLGYAWLAAGLILTGLAWTTGWLDPGRVLHAITVGALGTLTTMVMLRVRCLRARIDLAHQRIIPGCIAGLLSLAAVARVAGGDSVIALQLATAGWSVALLMLLGALLVSHTRKKPPRHKAGAVVANSLVIR